MAAAVCALACGLAAGFVFAGGASARLTDTGTTTTPAPEPPAPTTTPAPDPAPQPAPKPAPTPKPTFKPAPKPAPRPSTPHVAPAAPASPAPRTAVTRTTPATPAYVAPHRVPTVTKTRRTKPVHRHVRRAKHPVAPPAKVPDVHVRVGDTLGAEATRAPAASAVAPTTPTGARRLFIVSLLGVACLMLAFTALPPRRLPWRLAWAVEERRVEILSGGLAAFVVAVAAIFWAGP